MPSACVGSRAVSARVQEMFQRLRRHSSTPASTPAHRLRSSVRLSPYSQGSGAESAEVLRRQPFRFRLLLAAGQAPSAAVGRFPRHKWPNQGNLSRASPQQGRPPGRPGPLSTPLALKLTAVPLETAGTPAVSRVSLRCRKSGDPGTVLARPAQNCTRGAVRRAATGVNPLEPWRPHHVRPVALSPLLRPLDHGRRVPRAFGSQPVGD